LILVKNEKLILIGAVVSGAVGYFVMCIMNIKIVAKQTNTKFDFKNNVIKPVSIFLVAYFLSKFLNNFIAFSSSLLINLTIKITLSFLITILLCFLFKTLNFSEFFLHKR
jgi:H+/Cl- antiporter ClcA